MSKPKRGKNAKLIKNWRGSCPACERTGVRLLWEITKDTKKLKVCKKCSKAQAS